MLYLPCFTLVSSPGMYDEILSLFFYKIFQFQINFLTKIIFLKSETRTRLYFNTIKCMSQETLTKEDKHEITFFCSFLLFSSHVTLTTWTQDTSVCWYTIMDTLFHWFFYTWQNKNTRFSRKISRFSSSNPFPQVLLNQFNISAFVFAHFKKIFLQQFQ